MNRDTKILYVPIGAPGSGKSTYYKDHFQKRDIVRISRDDIRYRLLRPGDAYFAHEKGVFKEFVREIKMGLDRYEGVYADATHLNPISRLKLLNALELDYNKVIVTAINFMIPLETCLERNAGRNGIARVGDDVVRKLYGLLEFAEMGEEPFSGFINVRE